MGLAHSPRTVTDGLVLALDAGSPKNYNVGVSTNWTDTIGGNNGTLVGGAHHTDGPFVGAGYVEFDGNSDRINIPASSDFNFGTGDFTVEWWQYLPSTPSEHLTLLSINYGTNPNFSIQGNGATSTAYAVYFNGISTSVIEGSSCPLNQWVHYAVVRNGSGSNNVKIYRDGVQTGQGTYTGNAGNSSSTNYIGGDATNSSVDFEGYVSNLRVVKGTALYTSAFTPPTKSLTAITNTVLLTCQGNAIADASSSGHTLTTNGDAAANLGFPASAFEFDGTDDVVTVANMSTFAPTAVTFETWFKHTYSAGYKGLIDKGRDDYEGYSLNIDEISRKTRFKVRVGSSNKSVSCSTEYVDDVWNHVVGTYDGTDLKIYLNGSLDGTTNAPGTMGSNTIDVRIGSTNDGLVYDGNIAISRIYNRALTAAEVLQNYNATKGRYA